MILSKTSHSLCSRANIKACTPNVRQIKIRCALSKRLQCLVRANLTNSPIQHFVRDAVPWPTAADCPLQKHNLQQSPIVDLVVCGAGPAGVAVAERVAKAGLTVCVVDPAPLSIWPNNYGVWVDEFQAMGLEDCLEVIWPKAKVWLHSGDNGEKFLSRPYARVDRPRLKKQLLNKCIENGVTFLEAKVTGVSHAGGQSTVTTSDGAAIKASLVLDASGHNRALVNYDKKFDPGYQGAYGIVAEVESHPFDVDTMLFMDWRDDHTAPIPDMQRRNAALPTFLYAMPFSKTRIFLEETSLVARPALDFKDLKERLQARLEWLGVKVLHIEEEEYCLIPMGGHLPTHPQRVVAVGGTAGMVHPSTGFMLARALGSAPTVADAIVDQLFSINDKAAESGLPRRPFNEQSAEAMSASIWRTTWPIPRLRQRAFNWFGMEVLLKLDLEETRQFFAAFFSLSDFHWQGFLSLRLSFWQLITFGLSLFIASSNSARANLLRKGAPDLGKLLLQLLPTLGDYYKTGSPRERPSRQLSLPSSSNGVRPPQTALSASRD